MRISKIRYCKKCGGIIDNRSMVCSKCNRHCFRFKPMHLINTVLILVIICLSTACIRFYTMYQDALIDVEYYSDKSADSLDQIKKLKSQVSELEERNERQANRMSALAERPRVSAATNGYNNTMEHSENNTATCAIPSCQNNAKNNSFYCDSHECLDVGCHEKRANDFCNYCVAHKCIVPDCNFGRALNNVYCHVHKSN